VSFLTPNDLYRLGNAWEVYFRVIQFLGVYAFIYQFTKIPAKSILIALPVIFSYWIQYEKDFNAWAHLVTVAYLFYIIAFIYKIQEQFQEYGTFRHKYYLYLLVLAMTISHPEFAILILIGLIGSGIIASNNFKNLIIGDRKAYFHIIVLIVLIALVHPYIFSWLIRMFNQSPGMTGGIETMTRGFYYIFSADNHRYKIINELVNDPIQILIRPEVWSDMITSLFGFSPLAYLGSIGSMLVLIFAIVISFINRSLENIKNNQFRLLSYCLRYKSLILGALIFIIAILVSYYLKTANDKQNINNIASIFCAITLIAFFFLSLNQRNFKKFKFIIFLFLYLTIIFIIFVSIHSYGGAYRMIGLWGSLGTLLFAIVLWTSDKEYTKPFAIFTVLFYMSMGLSVFIYQNKGGFETYPKFYPNSTGFRHFEIDTVRDKWDYDYRFLIPDLLLCKSVYVNLPSAEEFKTRAPRFFQANIMLFLDNNNVNYYLANSYLNSGILGDPMYLGYRNSRNLDCELSQEKINGVIKYKLVKHHSDNFRGEK
jgi:hypothetical protein